jgi:hypothetical protein
MVNKTDLKTMKDILENGNCTLILLNRGRVIVQKEGRGVKPLIELLSEYPGEFNGGTLGDKIMGRAAALLCAYGQIKEVYTPLISIGALNILNQFEIPVIYEQKTQFIYNRDRTDRCPMEKLTEGVSNPSDAFAIIKSFIEEKSRAKH